MTETIFPNTLKVNTFELKVCALLGKTNMILSQLPSVCWTQHESQLVKKCLHTNMILSQLPSVCWTQRRKSHLKKEEPWLSVFFFAAKNRNKT